MSPVQGQFKLMLESWFGEKPLFGVILEHVLHCLQILLAGLMKRLVTKIRVA
jgi:hypothetical protein